ncbi:flagellar basal body rod protein FlgC [Phreatobacter oligotrophus]|jgi:flagellar basal-body rod protein FlgC|uniref:Flagellar basal-body rod protein FlgC n=1 Tax=Phreatobacter oligotrophus TaxID=1122261 RepID=A0A2T4YZ54_9HYPH|nr:flagellar basal body rod protein FlgC [Phreatobacter oligotrophus]PTM52268.1 flagellar basal-body rod protein FlgC [Phreatobacter oligotrophus]
MSEDFLKSIRIAAGGMRAQAGRMRVSAENIANANSTAGTPGGDPYRRKIPTFRTTFDRELQATTVQLGPVRQDQSEFRTRYDPNHPAADPRGYVKVPNVNSLVESMDLREAQRSYEANLNVVTSTRRMIQRTIELLRS